MKMINEFKEIVKNYYNLINDDKKKLIPYYIGYFLNAIIELVIPIFVAKITESLTNSLFIATTVSIIMYFIIKTANSLISYFSMYMYQNFYQNNYITMYKKIVKKIYGFDEEYKKKISTGKMINSLTSDVINVGEMADNILTIILHTLECIVVIVYFFKINIYFAVFIFIVDIFYIARSNYLNNLVIKYSKKQKNENDKLIGLINQTLLGLRDIQTLDFTTSMNSKYDYIYKSWKEIYNKKKEYERYRRAILKCFLTIIITIVYFICMYLIINNKITIGIMLIIISYIESLFSSSENIMTASQSMREQNISVKRIMDILQYNDTKIETLKSINNIRGKIEFKDVYFSYNDENFLEDLNFTINTNQITAITGANGVGKTTIINLILRLYYPSKGRILIDNIDINKIDKKSYLNQISILNQDTYLFNLSIRENFNMINNNIKKQEKICKFIGIDEFIKSLPKGYDTIIDENSHNISGGQKRLLSLARTLLKDSKILIFDEATSSLDKEKIQDFIKVLEKLKNNHTIIVITHKKEIIDIVDEVIEIEQGKAKIKNAIKI